MIWRLRKAAKDFVWLPTLRESLGNDQVQVMALYHQPWPPCAIPAARLDLTCPVEEEKTPNYSPERFYPIRLGQLLNGRYQVATKLGYGANSTVWLARDLNRYDSHNNVKRKRRSCIATDVYKVEVVYRKVRCYQSQRDQDFTPTSFCRK